MRAFFIRVTGTLVALGPLFVAFQAVPAESARPSNAEILFRLAHPCPATGQTHGACKGYVVDRVIPLVCGGAEAPDNMQWQTLAEAKEKDRWEKIGCRRGRTLVLPGKAESSTEAFALGGAPGPVEREALPSH